MLSVILLILLKIWVDLLFEKKQKDILTFFGAKKEAKKHPPSPSLTSSSSVTTRESRSKLHSLLAAPSVLPIWRGCS